VKSNLYLWVELKFLLQWRIFPSESKLVCFKPVSRYRTNWGVTNDYNECSNEGGTKMSMVVRLEGICSSSSLLKSGWYQNVPWLRSIESFLFLIKKAASTRISQLKHILKHYVITFIDAETTEIPKCHFFNCIMLGKSLSKEC
jgi:hypothetical protein